MAYVYRGSVLVALFSMIVPSAQPALCQQYDCAIGPIVSRCSCATGPTSRSIVVPSTQPRRGIVVPSAQPRRGKVVPPAQSCQSTVVPSAQPGRNISLLMIIRRPPTVTRRSSVLCPNTGRRIIRGLPIWWRLKKLSSLDGRWKERISLGGSFGRLEKLSSLDGR